MKRAILITTGTVVGITSVLAYKPDAAVLALVPGAEALTTTAGVTSQSPTDAVQNAVGSTPTASAAPSAASAAPSSAGGTSAKSTSKASAAASPSASAATAAAPTSSASASASAPATASSNAAGTIAVGDGTHTGASAIVESHGRTYGSLVATVTVSNGQMTDLSFAQSPTGRNEQFISAVNTYLVPEILRTQNVQVGIVSGATGTSMALISSLQSALGMA